MYQVFQERLNRRYNAEQYKAHLCKAYKVQYGLGFQKYYLFTAYIFTKKQAKYVLQKNKYSLVLENEYCNPKTKT